MHLTVEISFSVLEKSTSQIIQFFHASRSLSAPFKMLFHHLSLHLLFFMANPTKKIAGIHVAFPLHWLQTDYRSAHVHAENFL